VGVKKGVKKHAFSEKALQKQLDAGLLGVPTATRTLNRGWLIHTLCMCVNCFPYFSQFLQIK